jgi:hypothetical protein
MGKRRPWAALYCNHLFDRGDPATLTVSVSTHAASIDTVSANYDLTRAGDVTNTITLKSAVRLPAWCMTRKALRRLRLTGNRTAP